MVFSFQVFLRGKVIKCRKAIANGSTTHRSWKVEILEGHCKYCLNRSSKACPMELMTSCASPSQHSKMWQAMGTRDIGPLETNTRATQAPPHKPSWEWNPISSCEKTRTRCCMCLLLYVLKALSASYSLGPIVGQCHYQIHFLIPYSLQNQKLIALCQVPIILQGHTILWLGCIIIHEKPSEKRVKWKKAWRRTPPLLYKKETIHGIPQPLHKLLWQACRGLVTSGIESFFLEKMTDTCVLLHFSLVNS